MQMIYDAVQPEALDKVRKLFEAEGQEIDRKPQRLRLMKAFELSVTEPRKRLRVCCSPIATSDERQKL